MGWTFTGRSAAAGVNAANNESVVLNSTVAGNFIGVATLVFSAGGTAPTSIAVSDNINGSYTQSAYKTNGDMGCAIHFFAVGAGGNLTITSDPSGAASDSQDIWVAAAEFSGGAASPASGTPTTNSGSSTSSSTGTTTPADNNCLVLATMATDASSPATITENAGSEGYTLILENETVPGELGSFVYKILSGGSGAGQSESWTQPTEAWAAVIAAFKPSTATFNAVPQMTAWRREVGISR
jgi:hypothetical protein